MTGNPLLLLSVMLELVGVQFLSMGLITELLTRTYFESQGKAKLPKFDLALSLSSGGQRFTAGAVSTGEKGFLPPLAKIFYPVLDGPPGRFLGAILFLLHSAWSLDVGMPRSP